MGDGKFDCLTAVEGDYPEDDVDESDITSGFVTRDYHQLVNATKGTLDHPFQKAWNTRIFISWNDPGQNYPEHWHWDSVYFTAIDKNGKTHRIATSTWDWNVRPRTGPTKREYYEKLGISLPTVSFTFNSKDFTISQVASGSLFVEYMAMNTASYDAIIKSESVKPAEITIPLAPTEYDPTGQEYLILILPTGKNEVDCLSCYSFDKTRELSDETLKIRELAVDKLNDFRATHPALCVDPCETLELNHFLSTIGDTYLSELYADAPYDSPHVAKETFVSLTDGETYSLYSDIQANFDDPLSYVQAIFYSRTMVVDSRVEPPSDQVDPHSLEALMNDALVHFGTTDAVYRSENKLLGTSIFNQVHVEAVREGNVIQTISTWRGIVAFIFMWGETPPADEAIPPLTNSCMLDCVNEIKWEQGKNETSVLWYSEDKYSGEHQEVYPALPFFIFPQKVPQICTLRAIHFVSETMGVRATYTPGFGYLDTPENPTLLPIPEDGSLKYNNMETWNLTFPTNDAYPFIPGEWIAFYAEILTTDRCVMGSPEIGSQVLNGTDCCYFLLSYGWFETECLTSGIIKGCGLFENGAYTDGGYGQDWKSSYKDNDKLRWVIMIRGTLYNLRPSDYTRYTLDKRAFVYKGGVAKTLSTVEGSKEKANFAGCRNRGIPKGPFDPLSNPHYTPLTYSAASYKIDMEKDQIVPEKLTTYIGVE